MRGRDAWNADAIDRVLASGGKTGILQTGESEEARLSHRQDELSGGEGLPYQGIEFWDTVSGRWLIDSGLIPGVDPDTWYPICALVINWEVVRALLNPDPRGYKPFYVNSFSPRSGQVCGVSMPRKLKDCQRAANSTARGLVNNAAFSSGPMVGYDNTAIDPSVLAHKLHPMMIFPFDGRKASLTGDPVRFFQPRSNTAQAIQVLEFWEAVADRRSNVPRYAHGDPKVTGAGETASGLAMLFDASAKGIKKIIGNQDRRVIRPAVYSQYLWNLVYLEGEQWEGLKGDCQVLPRGVTALIVKQELVGRLEKMLAQSANPADALIFQASERRRMWEELVRLLGMPKDFVPDELEIKRRAQAALQQQMDAAVARMEGSIPAGLEEQVA